MQALGRAADFAVTVNNVEDIAALPWFGNYASDAPLFRAVEDFIIDRAATAEIACAALYEQGFHGMGLEGQVTRAVLKQYLNECEFFPLNFTL